MSSFGASGSHFSRGTRASGGGLRRIVLSRRRRQCRPHLREFTAHVGGRWNDWAGPRRENSFAVIGRPKNPDTSACSISPDFPPSSKPGLFARQQQSFGLTAKKSWQPDAKQIGSVVASVKKNVPEIDGIIFEDYGKGFSRKLVSKSWLRPERQEVVTADPNPRNNLPGMACR